MNYGVSRPATAWLLTGALVAIAGCSDDKGSPPTDSSVQLTTIFDGARTPVSDPDTIGVPGGNTDGVTTGATDGEGTDGGNTDGVTTGATDGGNTDGVTTGATDGEGTDDGNTDGVTTGATDGEGTDDGNTDGVTTGATDGEGTDDGNTDGDTTGATDGEGTDDGNTDGDTTGATDGEGTDGGGTDGGATDGGGMTIPPDTTLPDTIYNGADGFTADTVWACQEIDEVAGGDFFVTLLLRDGSGAKARESGVVAFNWTATGNTITAVSLTGGNQDVYSNITFVNDNRFNFDLTENTTNRGPHLCARYGSASGLPVGEGIPAAGGGNNGGGEPEDDELTAQQFVNGRDANGMATDEWLCRSLAANNLSWSMSLSAGGSGSFTINDSQFPVSWQIETGDLVISDDTGDLTLPAPDFSSSDQFSSIGVTVNDDSLATVNCNRQDVSNKQAARSQGITGLGAVAAGI